MSKMFHQWVPPLLELSLFAIIYPFFSHIIVLFLINLFMWFAEKTPTKFRSWSLIFFMADSVWKFDIPLSILAVVELSLHLIYSVIFQVRFQYTFYVVFFNSFLHQRYILQVFVWFLFRWFFFRGQISLLLNQFQILF